MYYFTYTPLRLSGENDAAVPADAEPMPISREPGSVGHLIPFFSITIWRTFIAGSGIMEK